MSRAKGFAAEDRAAKWLTAQGFEVIDRNFYDKCGEIDIIAVKDEVIHFVEVKSGENFDPIYAITPTKLGKIAKTAERYLQRRGFTNAYTIDALLARRNEFELIENVTI
ncbi:MAG: YraN family protein [Helicobacteraceae bacterium]|nr:YraN family protein [Helicobacteraceae bacterium]